LQGAEDDILANALVQRFGKRRRAAIPAVHGRCHRRPGCACRHCIHPFTMKEKI
jgi:hypothetical protein